jgi:hypothetical protein
MHESDDENDNILVKKARQSIFVKLTIHLWLPKIQHAEDMLLNEEKTDLR